MKDSKTVLEFYSKTCRPCRMMMPLVNELVSSIGGITIDKVEISEDTVRAEAYGIKSVPTFVLLVDGVEKRRLVGVQTKKKMIQFLSE